MSEIDDDDAAEPASKDSAYQQIITKIFFNHWKKGALEFTFERGEIERVCTQHGIPRPKNLGDVIYSYRYRRALPDDILATQPKDRSWLILGAGDAVYRFRLNRLTHIVPTNGLTVRKIPDATPEIIAKYALNDEQALLARVRYNRLIDTFLGVTASALQSHLRSKIPNYGQIEIDELYVALDSRGSQQIVPVQAKAGRDRLGVIQTIQDTIFCQRNDKYANCIVRPVSAQFVPGGSRDDAPTIALFELSFDGDEVSIVREKQYRLVHRDVISAADLQSYNRDHLDN